MTCDACGGDTAVTDTRSPAADHAKHGTTVRPVKDLIGWYTSDWLARKRVCKTCKMEFITLEISCKDFVYLRDNKEPQND